MLNNRIVIGNAARLPLCRWSIGIIFLLEKNPMKPGQISSILGTSIEIVKMKLRMMKDAGLVKKDNNGLYVISEDGESFCSQLSQLIASGIEYTAIYDILSCKWMQNILEFINREERRWKDIINHLSPVSAKVLSEKLRKLESLGLLERNVKDTRPPSVTYRISNKGRMLAEWSNLYINQ